MAVGDVADAETLGTLARKVLSSSRIELTIENYFSEALGTDAST